MYEVYCVLIPPEFVTYEQNAPKVDNKNSDWCVIPKTSIYTITHKTIIVIMLHIKYVGFNHYAI